MSAKFKIEMKSQKHCLKSEKGNIKNVVSGIKLMNSLGDASARSISDVIKFDVLLLVDTGDPKSYSSGYINSSDLTKEYLEFKGDGVTLKGFPMSKVHMIYESPEDKVFSTSKFSYLVEKRKAQRSLINSFK